MTSTGLVQELCCHTKHKFIEVQMRFPSPAQTGTYFQSLILFSRQQAFPVSLSTATRRVTHSLRNEIPFQKLMQTFPSRKTLKNNFLLIYIQAPLFSPSQTLLSMLESVLWRWVITKSLLQSILQIKAEETCVDFKSEPGILCTSKWIKLCALHLQSVTYITSLRFVSLLCLKFSFLR